MLVTEFLLVMSLLFAPHPPGSNLYAFLTCLSYPLSQLWALDYFFVAVYIIAVFV